MFCNRSSGENNDDSSQTEANGHADDEYLDCGKAVNFTYYDNLVGVARRHRHPNVPEPQVSNSNSYYPCRIVDCECMYV